MKKLVMIMMSLVWLSSVACSKKGSSSVATPPVTYSWSGNICKDNNGNTVDNSLCPSNGGSGGYTIKNGCCYNTSNQQVDMAYCTGQAINCVGNFWKFEEVFDYAKWKWVEKAYMVHCEDNYGLQGFNNCSSKDLSVIYGEPTEIWLIPNVTGNPTTDRATNNWKFCQ